MLGRKKKDGMTLFSFDDFKSSDEFRGNGWEQTVKEKPKPNYTKEQIAERLLLANDKRRLTMIRKNLNLMLEEIDA